MGARDEETAPDPAAGPGLVLSIARGRPSAEQIAALMAVLAARAEQARPRAHVRSEWSARSRLLRAPISHGPGGWRASALPR
jgi:Acyl-CoA carboxylase epsilon subunit